MIKTDSTEALPPRHRGAATNQRIDILAQVLARYAREEDAGAVAGFLKTQPSADIATLLERMTPADALATLRQVPLKRQADILAHLKPGHQVTLSESMDRAHLVDLIGAMSPDKRADFYKALPPRAQEAILPGLAQAQRDDIRRLAAYNEGTAGAIMTSDYATLRPDMTAPEALEALRGQALDSETIYNAYIVDEDHILLGVLSLRDLLIARTHETVGEWMNTDPVAIDVDAPRKKAADRIARYDLIALPVTDAEGRMVGIITQDDAMDVAEAEATEEIYKSSSVGEFEGDVAGASLFSLYKARIIWLVLLVFGNIFSGAGISAFEATIADNLALLFFLPLLIGSGGNAGAQSATLMIRALATGDVEPSDWTRMLRREILTGVALGVTMALAVSTIGLVRVGPEVTIVVALAMVLIVLLGALIGTSLPFVLSSFKLDPATASGPLVTSICDLLGVLIYFGMAALLLGSNGQTSALPSAFG